MPDIRISDVCGASHITRNDGAKLRHRIEELWGQLEPVVIDFESVRIASVSFLDEGIGVLALCYPVARIRARLRLKNMQDADRRLLNSVIATRMRILDNVALIPQMRRGQYDNR